MGEYRHVNTEVYVPAYEPACVYSELVADLCP